MQRQPLVRLLDRVVVKLVIYPAGAQRFDQITANIFRELALMNDNVRCGRHGMVVADSTKGNKH